MDLIEEASYSTGLKAKDSDFHHEINRIFPGDGFVLYSDKSARQKQVDNMIYKYLPEFDQASIAALMYRSAKEWKRTKVSVVSRHLSRITNYMSRLPADGWTAKEVSNAVYGLQYMRSDDSRVLRFLSVISNIMIESLLGTSVDEDYEEGSEDSEEYSGGTDINRELRDFLNFPESFISTLLEPSSASEGLTAGFALRKEEHFSSSLSMEERSMLDDDDDSAPHGLLCIDDLIESSSSALSTHFPMEKILTARELSTVLYSLRGMRSDVKEVKSFLTVLNRLIYLSRSVPGVTFDVQGVSNALYGMQGMSSDCPEVRALITQLTVKIARSDDLLDSQAIGNALYGLKNMNSEHPEIRLLLRVLASRIDLSRAEMRSQEIANALYGLQGMSSEHAEVKELLTSLERKIKTSKRKEMFNAQEIGNALYGLQNMVSDSSEVRKLLSAVSKKMGNFEVVLNAQAVGSALIGFQGMSSDHKEVNNILSVFNKHLRNCDILDEKAVASLKGLQRMNGGSVEVRELLSVFADKIESCQGRLNKDEVTSVLFGLQNSISIDECEEVTLILGALIRQVRRSGYTTNHSYSSNNDIFEDKASKNVESAISSIRSVKNMCGKSTQLGVEEIMSLLMVGDS